MIRKTILISLLWISASYASGVDQEESPESRCGNAITTAQMMACMNRHFRKADEELNQVYSQLMSQLSETRQTRLKEAQRAWIHFRGKNSKFLASAVEGGSMYPLVDVFWLTLMTEERIGELKKSLK